MVNQRVIGGVVTVALATVVGGFTSPSAFAGPSDPGFDCGAHTSPLDCWSNTGPATPGEIAFVDEVLSYHIEGVPTDRTRLLQIGRGTCTMLNGGTSPNYIVSELAQDLGKNEGVAGQIFIVAEERAC